MRISLGIVLAIMTGSAWAQSADDREAILASIDSYDRGWAEREIGLVLESYAEDVDWDKRLRRPRDLTGGTRDLPQRGL